MDELSGMDDTRKNRILVTGATGFLGVNLVHHLCASGFTVRALVRPGSSTKHFPEKDCEICFGMVDQPADVERAVAGCRYVVHAAGITGQWGIPFETYKRINVTATRHVAAACLKHGVEKIVHVGTANSMAPGTLLQPGTENNGFNLSAARSPYIVTKHQAQEFILEQARLHQLPAVVVNPTLVLGPLDLKPSSGQLLLLGIHQPFLLFPPGGKNIVHVQDVCQGIAAALHKGRIGDCYLLAGENLSYRQFFTLRNRLAGKKQWLIPAPAPVVKSLGAAATMASKLLRHPMAFNWHMAYLSCVNNYYSGAKATAEWGLQFSPAEKAMEDALQWFRAHHYY